MYWSHTKQSVNHLLPAATTNETEVGKYLSRSLAYQGQLIELEAVAFLLNTGEGSIRFNETAGSAKIPYLMQLPYCGRRVAKAKDYDLYKLYRRWQSGWAFRRSTSGYTQRHQENLYARCSYYRRTSSAGQGESSRSCAWKIHGGCQAGIKKCLYRRKTIKI